MPGLANDGKFLTGKGHRDHQGRESAFAKRFNPVFPGSHVTDATLGLCLRRPQRRFHGSDNVAIVGAAAARSMGLVGLLMALMLVAVLWLRGTHGPGPAGKGSPGTEGSLPGAPSAESSPPVPPLTGPIQRAREAVGQGEAANERLEKAIEELR